MCIGYEQGLEFLLNILCAWIANLLKFEQNQLISISKKCSIPVKA